MSDPPDPPLPPSPAPPVPEVPLAPAAPRSRPPPSCGETPPSLSLQASANEAPTSTTAGPVIQWKETKLRAFAFMRHLGKSTSAHCGCPQSTHADTAYR